MRDKMRCHIYFKVFSFQEQRHWIGFWSLYFRLSLHLSSVVLPCRFFKNTLRDLVFTIMQKETCFSYFWILWKSSENFRNSLQCFYQWKEWEANIMFFPPHCVLSVAWVCVSVCICVCVCLISVVFSKFESLTFKYMCVFF